MGDDGQSITDERGGITLGIHERVVRQEPLAAAQLTAGPAKTQQHGLAAQLEDPKTKLIAAKRDAFGLAARLGAQHRRTRLRGDTHMEDR